VIFGSVLSFVAFSLFTNGGDRESAIQKFVLQGDFDLKNQINSSHHFLYGHRSGRTKTEIENRAASFNGDSADLKTAIEENRAIGRGESKSR
jgi:hypothetical protein